MEMDKNALRQRYGSWAFITGASSGIGKAFAYALAEIGIHSIIVSNEDAELKKMADLLQKEYHVKIIPVCVDLASTTSLHDLLSIKEIQDVSIVINCAGYGLMGYTIQHKIEDYLHMIRTNEEAPIYITHFFTTLFYQKNCAGAIINVSSANAEFLKPIPFSAIYSSGKCMLKYFTEAVSHEMKPFKIDILNVSCGPTSTEFQAHAKTNKLAWCETPQDVVNCAFKALGKKSTVTTNRFTRFLIQVSLWFPVSRLTKIHHLGRGFRDVLAKSEATTLKDIPRAGGGLENTKDRTPFLIKLFTSLGRLFKK
jgi:short-subunit dehydrogenase